jgi:hypothetical protein
MIDGLIMGNAPQPGYLLPLGQRGQDITFQSGQKYLYQNILCILQ